MAITREDVQREGMTRPVLLMLAIGHLGLGEPAICSAFNVALKLALQDLFWFRTYSRTNVLH